MLLKIYVSKMYKFQQKQSYKNRTTRSTHIGMQMPEKLSSSKCNHSDERESRSKIPYTVPNQRPSGNTDEIRPCCPSNRWVHLVEQPYTGSRTRLGRRFKKTCSAHPAAVRTGTHQHSALLFAALRCRWSVIASDSRGRFCTQDTRMVAHTIWVHPGGL